MYKNESCKIPSLTRNYLPKKKIIAFLLIAISIIFFTDSAVAKPSSIRLDINLSKATLKEIFNSITEQSDLKFIYNNDVVNDNQKMTLKRENASLETILNEVGSNFKLSYKVVNKQVIIFPKKMDGNQSQTKKTITGKVLDEEGIALPGVSVMIKGTSIGIVTDIDGSYTLKDIPNNAKTIVFSFIGMKTQEVAITDQKEINITLIADKVDLDEVIAIGYASKKKANIIGSVTAVSGDKIAAIPAPDVTNALSGRLPGATFTQGSGEPGQNDAEILVRGRTTLGDETKNTAPLVVVDGIPDRSLSEIDPVDIESVTILKDASAAIYGATAANGVILVTTKKGKEGKPKLSYQFYQGFQTPTILPEVCNAGDYATMLSEYQDYHGKERSYSDEDIALFYSGRDPWEHPNSDWMGDLVSNWTTTSKHNITIEGGSHKMRYFVSLGYRNEEAIYEQESTNYNQYNLRAKLDIPITKWLKTEVNYAGFLKSQLYPTKGAGSIYGQATRLVPTQWSFWPTGEPGPDIEYGDNPVVTSTLETGTDETKNYVNRTTFSATITPPFIKGLTLNARYSLDIDNQYRKRFQKPWILYFPKWATAQRDSEGFITSMELTPTPRGVKTPELKEYYERSILQLANINFNYSRNFGEHSVSLFGAYEELITDDNKFDAFRKHYISDVVQTLNAGADADKTNSGSMSIYSRKSIIGRLNYSYKNRYLLEFLFRRDGSLKFPVDNRWGNFPALLLGWRASEEDFWKQNLSFINYFKLRGSYGQMGMDPGKAFQYMNKYVLASGATFGTGKVVETVVRQEGVANPNITWEKQTTYNLGFESQFLNNTFYLNADFFYSKRTDILVKRNASVPSYTGLKLPDENIGEVENRGFEIEAGYRKRFNSDLEFGINGNISYNHNEVTFMDEPERSVAWQQKEGHAYGVKLLYQAEGIFKDQAQIDNTPHLDNAKPGDVIFADIDGDGAITSDDRILLDKTDAPEIFYGVTFDVTYKNWNLSVLAQGQGTFYKQNIQDSRRGEAGNYFQWHFDDRWTPENTDTDVARAYNRDDLYWAFGRNNSTYWWDNMAYCRLKNATLTYTLPKTILKGTGISRASLYFSGNNLFLIYAAQKNFDPEIGNPMTYPAVKTFAIGARVTF